MSSLLKKIILAVGSTVAKLGGGEASEGGAINEGWGAVSSAGGGASPWTFPLGGEGGESEGFGGHASGVGGTSE